MERKTELKQTCISVYRIRREPRLTSTSAHSGCSIHVPSSDLQSKTAPTMHLGIWTYDTDTYVQIRKEFGKCIGHHTNDNRWVGGEGWMENTPATWINHQRSFSRLCFVCTFYMEKSLYPFCLVSRNGCRLANYSHSQQGGQLNNSDFGGLHGCVLNKVFYQRQGSLLELVIFRSITLCMESFHK